MGDSSGEDFKNAVKSMAEAAKQHKDAAGQLEKSAASSGAGAAAKKEFKSIKDSLTGGIVGALGPIGSIGEGMIKGMFSGRKQKKEEKALADQLGLTRDQMRAFAQEKQLKEKQAAAIEQLKSSGEAIGIPADRLNKVVEQMEKQGNFQAARDEAEADGVDKVQEAALQELKEKKEQVAATDVSGDMPSMLGSGNVLDNGAIDPTINTEAIKETANDMNKFVGLASTPGALMVHDIGVEGTLNTLAEGAAASEKEDANEQRRQQEKLVGTLEGIEDNTEGQTGPIGKPEGKGKGLLAGLMGGGGMFGGMEKAMASMGSKFLPGGVGGLKALAPKALAFLKVAGPVALVIGGVVAAASMVKDGIEGYSKAASGEWPVDKISGAIGASIGGTGSGAKNAMKQAMKGAAIGGAIGLIGGPVGALIGAAVGGAIGGIAGFIGGKQIATWVDGAVKSVRNIFNIPELLTPEQVAAADKRLEEIKTEVTTFDGQIATLEGSLKEVNLTGKARLDAMDTLAKLEADRDKTLEEQATLKRTLSNSNVAEAKAAVDRASEEFNNASKSAKQEKSKLFWLALRYGKDSDEYKAQLDRYDSASAWEKESQGKLEKQKTARAAAQKLHDETHKTMMGNVRLFWTGFTDSLPSWSDVKEGASAFIKDPLGTMKTSFSKFVPDITLPKWTDVKAGVTGFFNDPTAAISGAFSSFTAVLPDMEAIKNRMPDALLGAGVWASSAIETMGAGIKTGWKNVGLPALDLIKDNMPDSLKAAGAWTTAKILGLKDKLGDIKLPSMETIKTSLTGILDKYDITLPSWDSIKEGASAFIKDPLGTMKTTFSKFVPDITLPSWTDVKAGAGAFLKDPLGTMKTTFAKFVPDMTLPSWDSVKEGAGAFLKDPLGTMKTTFSKFVPDIELPSWEDVKAGAGAFFKDPAGSIKAGFAKFKIALPSWDTIKSSMPDSLVAGGEWAADKLTGIKDKLKGIALPAWNTIKENMPDSLKGAGVWAQKSLLGLKDKLADISLPSMATIAASMPDVLTGAGAWAKDKMTAWKSALPSVELPDLSEAMAGISDMAAAAKSKITGFFSGLFGAGDEEISARTSEEIGKHGQTLKAAKKSGIYDANWAGDSTINREALEEGVKSGLIQKDMLNAIIADEDISKEDLKFMKLLVEKATTGTSLHVRDAGIHERLDILLGQDFMKNVMRLEAASSKETPAGAGGGTVVIAPQTTNSSPAYVHMEAALGTTDPHTKVTMAHVF